VRDCDGWCYRMKKRELPPHLLSLQLALHHRCAAWTEPQFPIPPESPSPRCTRRHTPRRSMDFYYSTETTTPCVPSSRHVLVVATAPRKVSTLGATLASLNRAGSSRWPGPKILSSDGPLDDSLSASLAEDGWTVTSTPSPEGCARAFLSRLRAAIELCPDLDRLTFVEDDVEMCKNALDYMCRVHIPNDLALVTWFTYDYDWTSPRHPPQIPHPNDAALGTGRGLLGCRPSRFFILTQAVSFPRRTVDLLLDCPFLRDWPKLDGHDEMIAWALGDGLYAAHFPVLVQHTAGSDNSAVTFARQAANVLPDEAQEGARSSPLYVGPEFDANYLLPGR